MAFDVSAVGRTAITVSRMKALKPVSIALLLVSLLYLIGLLRHSPGAFTQLRTGGTATYAGTITQASETGMIVKTAEGTKTITIPANTPYAIFPKRYQTLIAVGLPSSRNDIVIGTTEASVSVQLPYLKRAQASRINLVRDDMLSGKVKAVTNDSITFKAFVAGAYTDQTLKIAPSATLQKLGSDGNMVAITLADVRADQGMYAYLNKVAGPDDVIIQRLIVADFTSTN